MIFQIDKIINPPDYYSEIQIENQKENRMTSRTMTLNENEKTQWREFLQSVISKQLLLTVQFPGGEEVMIQPKPPLKPLPALEGYIPSGWKDAIFQ